MKSRIIITGISGFIGNALAHYLSKDYQIIGIDKVEWEDKVPKSMFFKFDINDNLPSFDNIYAVIHLAAKAGVRESDSQFEQYVKDNILGTKHILDKCVNDWKPDKILVASSSSIYGDRHCDYKPKSFYAMTKVAVEELINTYRNNGSLGNIDATALRIFTVYGPGQRKGLSIGNFVNNILQDVPITVYGDGTQTRDFTYIDDLCKGIKRIIDGTGSLERYYELGSQNSKSLNDVIYLISKLTGKTIRIKYEPMNKYDVMSTLSEDSILTDTTPFETGLKNQIEWAKKKYKVLE